MTDVVEPLTTPPVGGYTAWYDASQISGLADGAAVSSWPDLSGNGLNQVQATGTKQPTYYKTTSAKLLNALPTVWFNGTSQGMQTAGNSGITALPVSVFLVFKTMDVAANNQRIVQCNSTFTCNVTILPPAEYTLNGPAAGIFGGTCDTNWHQYTGLVASGTSTLRVDGTVIQTGSIGGTVTNNPLCLGALTGQTGQWLNGAIAELIVYTTALTGPNVTAIESYLNAKWFGPPTISSTACAVTLGPLTTTVLGADTDAGTAALPLGPLATAVPSSSVTVGGCGRGAWLTLGAAAVNLDDERAGYFCTQLDLGWPAVREVTSNSPDADGVVDRTQYMGSRVVSANITAVAGAGARIDQVAAMFAPFMAPSARPVLHYVLDRPGVAERTLVVRGSGYSWPVAGPYQRDIQLQWVAADPVARNPAAQVVTATTSSPTTLATPGDVPARPVFRITGPITAPNVTITPTTGPAWHLAFQAGFTIAAGHFVDVDTAARTVYLDADPAQPRLSSMDWTQSSWQWLPTMPASSTMALAGTGTTGATQVTATWQDGYLT